MGAAVSSRRRSREPAGREQPEPEPGREQPEPERSRDGAAMPAAPDPAPGGAAAAPTPAPPAADAATSTSPPPPPTTAPPNLLARVPLEHLPANLTVHAALFRGVANSSFLHARLLARDASFSYALVDASVLVSATHLLAAAYRAANCAASKKLRTQTAHSEVVFCLGPSGSIAEAYRRFGIGPATRDVAVVKVLDSDEEGGDSDEEKRAEGVWRHLRENVEGEPVPFTDDEVARCTDWQKVRKYYRLNGAAALAGIKDEDARRRESEVLILGAMALRGV